MIDVSMLWKTPSGGCFSLSWGSEGWRFATYDIDPTCPPWEVPSGQKLGYICWLIETMTEALRAFPPAALMVELLPSQFYMWGEHEGWQFDSVAQGDEAVSIALALIRNRAKLDLLTLMPVRRAA